MNKSRILVVDDEQSVREACAITLVRAGFGEPVFARSADEAFQLLGLAPEPDGPAADCDLILIDIGMPVTDGIEASARIRLDRRYREVPIIVFSGHNDPATLQQVFLAGAHDFLAKPLNRAELIARVHAALRFRREVERRRAREAQLQALLAEMRGPSAGSDEDQIETVATRELAKVVSEVAQSIGADALMVRRILDALADLEQFPLTPRRQRIAAMLADELLLIADDAALHAA